MDVAGDTALTDLTCTACGSHFSLVDQSKATWMAPLLTKLGRFELIERLGVGGFGTVWKARDKELDRPVAIKIPRQSVMTGEEQEKFFREARAAAQLRHPSIVSVHEVGRDGDSVYIVSDFVRGVTLGDWLTGQQPTSREAAELCAKIADALHHAHEQGVVHRDLKPANIMIDGSGEPHLMDFGLARREVGEVTVTMDGQVLGTPAYMSPEQAQGEAHKADRRSDIYSLGVILFQLLTGELPFRGNARMLIHQVINDEPPSPRRLNGNVPKDLATIALKCLEKVPARRYQSASELSTEFRRYLAGDPIKARPIGRIPRAWRWAKRRPAAAALLAVVAVVAVVGPIVATQQALLLVERDRLLDDVAAQQATLKAASVRLEKKNDELQNQLARNFIERGSAECESGRIPQGIALFAAAHDVARPDDPLRRSARNLIAAWYANAGTPLLHDGTVVAVAFSPDDCLILTASRDSTTRQWEVKTGEPHGPVIRHNSWVQAAVYSPDGRTILTGDGAGTAQVWDAKTGDPISEAMIHSNEVRTVAFSPDGRMALTGSADSTARLWDATTGKSLRDPLKHGSSVRAATFSPDERLILTGTAAGVAQLWGADTGKKVGQPLRHEGRISAVAFSPDGSTVATGSWDGSARLWDARTQKRIGAAMVHSSSVDSLAFNPDGTTLASGSYDHTARLWDARTGAAKAEPLRHDAGVASVAYSQDGRWLLTGTWDKTAWLWDVDTLRPLAFGINKRVTSSIDLTGDRPITAVALTPDSHEAITATNDGTVRFWDIAAGKVLGKPLQHGNFITAIAVSADGRTLLTASRDGTARLWNITTRQPQGELIRHAGSINTVAFSPDGRAVLTGSGDGTSRMWDATTGKAVSNPLRHTSYIRKATFSRNGRLIAVAAGGSVRMYDRATDKTLGLFRHPGQVLDAAFSPDGSLLLTACEDHEARFWAAATGKIIGAPLRHEEDVRAVAFSPDGYTVLTGGQDGCAQFWDVVTRKKLGEPLRHDHTVEAVAFSPDGRWVITGGGDQVGRLWPVPVHPSDSIELTTWSKGQTALAVEPDGLIKRISCAEWFAARNWHQSGLVEVTERSTYLEPAVSAIRQSIGKRLTVELQVATVGSVSGLTLLNSMAFTDPDCFTVVIAGSEARKLHALAGANVEKLVGRRIRVTGIVVEWQDTVEIKVDNLASQIEILTLDNQWVRYQGIDNDDSSKDYVNPPVAKLRTLIGGHHTVEFRVRMTGGIHHIYLNSMLNFQHPDCFTAAIEANQASSFNRIGIDEPLKELISRIVRVTGTLEDRDGQIQIRVTDLTKQLEIMAGDYIIKEKGQSND